MRWMSVTTVHTMSRLRVPRLSLRRRAPSASCTSDSPGGALRLTLHPATTLPAVLDVAPRAAPGHSSNTARSCRGSLRGTVDTPPTARPALDSPGAPPGGLSRAQGLAGPPTTLSRSPRSESRRSKGQGLLRVPLLTLPWLPAHPPEAVLLPPCDARTTARASCSCLHRSRARQQPRLRARSRPPDERLAWTTGGTRRRALRRYCSSSRNWCGSTACAWRGARACSSVVSSRSSSSSRVS